MVKDSYFLDLSRVPVFIGKNGEWKSYFEKKFNCILTVNSNSGEVIVDCEDGYISFVISNIINAINHGHNPKNALKLEDENYVLDYVDVKSKVKDSVRLKVVMGRIIGKNGVTRKIIEDTATCSVFVGEDYVSIIGPFENISLVHEALEMLIKGVSHKSFYSYLEKNRVNMDRGLL